MKYSKCFRYSRKLGCCLDGKIKERMIAAQAQGVSL